MPATEVGWPGTEAMIWDGLGLKLMWDGLGLRRDGLGLRLWPGTEAMNEVGWPTISCLLLHLHYVCSIQHCTYIYIVSNINILF